MSDDLPPGAAGEPTIRLHRTPSDETPSRGVTMATGPRELVLDEAVKEAIDAHVGADTSVERGGVLVGELGDDGELAIVAAIPGKYAVGRPASLRFTHETWEYVNDVITDKYPDLKMVGWYHSHPGFGIFLSEYDTFIHQNFFSAPWQVAYVVDPLLGQAGFFGWEDGRIVRYRAWHVLAHGSARSVNEPVRGRDPGPATGTPPSAPGASATPSGVPAAPPGHPLHGGVTYAPQAGARATTAHQGVNPWTAGLATGLVALLAGAAIGYLVRGGERTATVQPTASEVKPTRKIAPVAVEETFDLAGEARDEDEAVRTWRLSVDRVLERDDQGGLHLRIQVYNEGDQPFSGWLDNCAPGGWDERPDQSTGARQSGASEMELRPLTAAPGSSGFEVPPQSCLVRLAGGAQAEIRMRPPVYRSATVIEPPSVSTLVPWRDSGSEDTDPDQNHDRHSTTGDERDRSFPPTPPWPSRISG